MLRAASAIACRPEEQKRLTVWAAAVTGRPARIAHWRAMLPPVAPSGLAQPIVTSSTSPGSMPARLTAWATTWPPMSAPCVRLNTPRTALPIGVRAVDTMTASTMGRVLSVLSSGACHRDPADNWLRSKRECGFRCTRPGMNVHSAAALAFCRSSSISSFLDSFPTAVFGRASRNSRCAGISYLPTLSARNTRSSSRVKAAAPGFSCTNALAASPR